MHESSNEFKFQIPPPTPELSALGHLKIDVYNVVNTLAPSLLIGSFFLLLQVMRTTIISRTSSKFGKIRPRTAELAALERREKSP